MCRDEARRLSRLNTGDRRIDVLLAKFAEVMGVAEWKVRAMWHEVPAEKKDAKLAEIIDITNKIISGEVEILSGCNEKNGTALN